MVIDRPWANRALAQVYLENAVGTIPIPDFRHHLCRLSASLDLD